MWAQSARFMKIKLHEHYIYWLDIDRLESISQIWVTHQIHNEPIGQIEFD